MQAIKFIHVAGMALLLGYLTLGWLGIHAGISSLDAYGVMHAVTGRLQTGDFAMSRPPGHPLSEFWMLPAVAWVMDGGSSLSPETYGFYQLAGGLCCLGFFWLLLRESAVSPARRLLAAACLVFSPQFLIESSDGEEFLWGTACILAALLMMARLSAGRMSRPRIGWSVAMGFAVAASGYRIEFGAVALAMVFWTLMASDRSLGEKTGLGVLAVIFLALLWGPFWFRHGVSTIYPNPLEARVRLAVGLYKIVFLSLGAIPLAFATIFFMQARGPFRIIPPFGKDILAYWLPWLVIIFFCLFFVCPTKIQVVLPGVAFLILLGAVRAKGWLWTCFVAACMSTLLLHVDCFENRIWTGLKGRPGLWSQSLHGKPACQRPKLEAALRPALAGRRVIVANIWPWDFAWHLAHGSWPGVARSDSTYKGWVQAYQAGPGIVMSRMILEEPDILRDYARSGYEVWIDEDLYREVFMRYELSEPTPSTALMGGVTCRIVDIRP